MRGLAQALAVIAILAAQSGPAAAHHGFSGRYDRANPLYAEGVVTMSSYTLPHGLITIQPSPPRMPPADLGQLDETSYARLGGRFVIEGARPVEAVGGGVITLLLPPPMTSVVAGLPARPVRGDTVGAVIFRECDTGELRVQLLRISAEQRVLRDGVIQREVDGCTGGPVSNVVSPIPVTPSPTLTATPATVAIASPVPVATEEQADNTSVVLLILAAGAAAAVALAVGLIAAKRA